MSLPSLRERLKSGAPFLATFSMIPTVEAVELIGLAGFEGVILDIEHGAHQSEALGPLILAARARGIYSLVRVRSSDVTGIAAALDAGAAGVIVPQIGSAAEALRAVRAARLRQRAIVAPTRSCGRRTTRGGPNGSPRPMPMSRCC